MIFHLSGPVCLLASSLTTTKLAFFVIVRKSSPLGLIDVYGLNWIMLITQIHSHELDEHVYHISFVVIEERMLRNFFSACRR